MEWEQILSTKRIYEDNRQKNDFQMYSEFEMDYHKIIGSPVFRRLQDKTQAFPLATDDFIRTRLTHSLEVSSIGKALGASIYKELRNQKVDLYFAKNSAKDITDILLCAGLIHDIGNPPFGHFGENAIRDWFKKNLGKLNYKDKKINQLFNEQMLNDLYNFEGNAQALRVLSKNTYLNNENGLNLTSAVLNTIIKYPIKSTEIGKSADDIKYKKMGYFYSENKLYKDIGNITGAKNVRHPLTFVLEAADDIAYMTSDIEDSIVKNILSYDLFLNCLIQYGDNFLLNEDKEIYKDLINYLKKSYTESLNYDESKPGLCAVQKWTSRVKNILIEYATKGFSHNYHEIMEGNFKNDLFYNSFAERFNNILSEITENYIFKDKEKIKIELSGTVIIQFLLDKFINASIYFDSDTENSLINKKTMEIFSKFYKGGYFYNSKNKNEIEKLYLRFLMVTDCISGMTDSYAKKLYKELNAF